PRRARPAERTHRGDTLTAPPLPCDGAAGNAGWTRALDSFGRKPTLSVDRLVRQVMFMPYGIENAESAREGDSENPGKVPHSASLIETGRIVLNTLRSHLPAHDSEH